MTTITTSRAVVKKESESIVQLSMKKDWKTWQRLAGIWRKRKLTDPVRWQRTIRSETQ